MEGTVVVDPPDVFRLSGPPSRPVSPSANLDIPQRHDEDDDEFDFDPEVRRQDVEEPRPGQQLLRTREDEE